MIQIVISLRRRIVQIVKKSINNKYWTNTKQLKISIFIK